MSGAKKIGSREAPPAEQSPEAPTAKQKPERPQEALRSTERVDLPGVKARFIDDLHAVGVKFDFDDKNERPSKEVTAVLKEDGFGWNLDKQQWRKRISRENPIADRHDAQESFAEAVERLRKDREGRGR